MTKLIKISFTSVAGLGLALSVLAQTTSITPTPSRTPLTEQREGIRDVRREGMEEIKEMRKMTHEEMDNLRREYQNKIREARAELQSRIDAKRTQLKNDLMKIKDERKKQTTERVDKSLDALNERMTNHFVNTLDKLDDVLERIEERTERVASKSIDVSLVETAIENAHKSITDAKDAVQVQAGKTYKVVVTTDAGLKDAVKKARQALHDDLTILKDKVKAARDAVHEAARAYAKAHGRDLPSPSPSVLVSPTVLPTATP